jgi:hypothetical protein
MRRFVAFVLVMLGASCRNAEHREPDLPRQPDRWVTSVVLDSGSKVSYVGKTRDCLVTSVTSIKEVNGLHTISSGDEIEGLHIGAIKCSFHWRDAYYAREQYMWRRRWGCQAGRDRDEVENAVKENGDKQFDYLSLAPVTLD